MDVQDIIRNSLIEYDSSKQVVEYLIDSCRMLIKKDASPYKRSVLIFEDKNSGEQILESEIEFLATFHTKYEVWCWAWSQPGLKHSENYLAKQILIEALERDSNLSYIKTILTTSRGFLKDSTQIDINLAIAASFAKKYYIYPFVQKLNDGNIIIYYCILINTDQLDNIKKKIYGK